MLNTIHMHIIIIVMTIKESVDFFCDFLDASLNFRIPWDMSEGENMGWGVWWND